ncbi:TPA: APC family permease [Klebsiella variicola subsp. variicola]|uniref:APC family permease n=1 Tax=Klebsiella variicola TaxID=244366 RepID=UPI0012555600|nr:APC family permease [Klebsiella variicola]MCX2362026.1 APC family permease [Klebsiella variicola]VAT76714.1 amino acid permease [Klebsiella variicola]HDK6468952.1 APC family permease [Klebsiella variicola]HDZ0569310.1 APC family permease [Klebsiella quasipneumoniae]
MSLQTKEFIDLPAPVGKHKLTGQMGAISLALTVLAFSAPLTTVSGYIPVAMMFGGVSAPLMFLMTTAIILLFAAGYISVIAMAKRPGDFYSFISFSLGKSVGLGAGLMASVSYFLILAGVASFFGVSAAELMKSIAGIQLPWYCYALICWAVVALFGYLHVELSAKVLSWVMLAEVIICLGFSGSVIGSGHIAIPVFSPFAASGLTADGVNAPFSILFAVSFFIGFEATSLFRDEVRSPEKTIPRATYGAIIFIGVIYTICAYALIAAYGPDVQTIAQNAPATMFSDALSKFISPRISLLVTLLVLTSSLASVLSVHNVLSRYLYNLGTDGALPRALRKVHPHHSSPFVASLSVSGLTLLVMLPFILTGVQPDVLYGQLSGVGTAGIIMLMTVVCIASLSWYFRYGRPSNLSVFKLFVAPLISGIFFVGLTVLVTKNFDLLVGGKPGERQWMLFCLLGAMFIGMALALYYKARRPDVFARLGRSQY